MGIPCMSLPTGLPLLLMHPLIAIALQVEFWSHNSWHLEKVMPSCCDILVPFGHPLSANSYVGVGVLGVSVGVRLLNADRLVGLKVGNAVVGDHVGNCVGDLDGRLVGNPVSTAPLGAPAPLGALAPLAHHTPLFCSHLPRVAFGNLARVRHVPRHQQPSHPFEGQKEPGAPSLLF